MVGTPQSLAKAVLEALIAEDGLLDGVVIKLFQNNVTPGPDATPATFTVADFEGYANSSEVTWGTVFHADSSEVQVWGDVKEFVATGDDPSNNIYGWYMTNAGGTVLKAWERFDEPVPVAEAGQGLAVLPVLVLPSDLFV